MTSLTSEQDCKKKVPLNHFQKNPLSPSIEKKDSSEKDAKSDILYEIHISGAPGSGKSYLGEVFQRQGYYVVDMDDFFQPGDGRWEILKDVANPIEKSHRWNNMKKTCFSFYRQQAKCFYQHRRKSGIAPLLIWVGLTDHSAPLDEPFYEIDGLNCKYYVKVTPEVLCRQYYTRAAQTRDTDWLQIPSSKRIILESKKMRKVHLEHGYIEASADEIVLKLKAWE